MRFHVLGALRVTSQGEALPLGGPKQRLVLALLLAAGGETVSVDRLIDGLWHDDPPESARKSIQVYVHNLRRVVGEAIVTEGLGYRLGLAHGELLDASQFEDGHRRGLDLLEGDPEAAARILSNSLALWSGPPYADLDGALALEPEIARLGELRLQVIEDRIDADLHRGAHQLVVSELEALTREYPLRERLRGQYMLALYRLGRHGEALRAYDRTRRFLLEEMGLDPSPELRLLEEQILNQAPELAAPGVIPNDTATRAVRGYELREVVNEGPRGRVFRAFQTAVGREAAVTVIDGAIADDPRFISTFSSESLSIAQLDHPHILPVSDFWREPGAAYVVTPWMDGGTLADAVADDAGPQLTLRNLEQVGSALAYAHRRGVVHGSLSAADIAFDGDGNAYLAGFDVRPVVGPHADADDGTAGGGVSADIAGLGQIAAEHLSTGQAAREPLARVLAAPTSGHPGFRNVEDLMRSIRQALGSDVTAVASHASRTRSALRNPYKGLRAFQEPDAPDFFGRSDLVATLLTAVVDHALVAVVGPSGSGKSSVVKAGLLPALRKQAANEGPSLLVTEMYPGSYPFEELEASLLRVAVAGTGDHLDPLRSDDRGLLRAVKQALPNDDSRLLIVIDQFEELFSMVDDEPTRTLFLQNLVTAATEPQSRISFVLTLRADFFDRPLRYPDFAELVERGLIAVAPPDRDGLAQAIVGPAHSVGLDLEPGFITEVTGNLVGEPGGLPLMQYALTELFENRATDRLTIAEYRRLGGVGGALGARAESMFQSLPAAGQTAIRQCFLRLITVDEQANDVRRRVRRSELMMLDVDQRELDDAIRQFGSHRLLTFDRDPHSRTPTIEVAHEALLRGWGRLQGWVDAQREDLILHRGLTTAADEWLATHRDASYLLHGGRLQQLEAWVQRTDISLTSTERDFVDASIAQRFRDEAREAATARRLRRMLVGVSLFAVIAIAAGLLAALQWRSADDQRAQTSNALIESETRRLASEAARLPDSDRRVALLLAVEAFNRDPGPDTLGAMQQVFLATQGFVGYVGAQDDYLDVNWLSGDRLLAVRNDGVDAIQLDGSVAETAIPAGVSFVEVDPARSVVAVASGSAVTLYDAATLDPLPAKVEHDAEVLAISFTPDGTVLATGDRDGFVRLWDAASGQPLGEPVAAHPERAFSEFGLDPDEVSGPRTHQPTTFRVGVSEISFDVDQTRMLTAGMVVVRIWDLPTLRQVGDDLIVTQIDSDGVETATSALALSQASGDDPVLIATERALLAWHPGEPPEAVARATPALTVGAQGLAADVAIDGSRAAYAQAGSTLTVVSSASSQPMLSADSHLSGGASVAFSPDGTRIAHAGDGGVAVWSLLGDGPINSTADARLPAAGSAMDGQASVAGEVTVSASGDVVLGTADATPSQMLRFDGTDLLEVDPSLVRNWEFLWFAPRQTMLGIRDLSGNVIEVLDPSDLQPLHAPLTPRGFFALHIGSNGWLAMGDQPPIVEVFELEGGAAVAVLDDLVALGDDDAQVGSIGFSPDGTRLVAATTDGAAVVWDTTSWEPVEPFPLSGGAGQVVFAKFSPDGFLVTIADSGIIVIRDEVSLQPSGPPLLGASDVAGIGHGPFFQPDGRHMVTTGHGEPRLWSLTDRVQVGQAFPNDLGLVPSASEDGRWLATLSGEQIVLWDLDLDSWPATACRVAGRNLTLEEWAQFGPKDDNYHATCQQWPIDDEGGTT